MSAYSITLIVLTIAVMPWQALRIAYTLGKIEGIKVCGKINDRIFDELERQQRVRSLRP